MAAPTEPRSSALAPLPQALVHRIFALLPADSRARAACVAPAWRDALAEPALWTRLDLSRQSGVAVEVTDAVLCGAARRAQGQLSRLDLSDRFNLETPALLETLAANAGSMRELRVDPAYWDFSISLDTNLATFEALVAAAPHLRTLDADVHVSWEDAPRVLRAEGALGPLRLRHLKVVFFSEEDEPEDSDDVEDPPPGGIERVRPVAELLDDTALQPTLSDLTVCGADLLQPEVMDALADVVLARQLRNLALERCSPPAAASLARLIAGGSNCFA